MGRLPAQVRLLKAAAFFHGPARISAMADAFRLGCKRHGIPCDVLPVGKKTAADVIWLYGMGPALPAFEMHPGAVRLVGDKGYFDEYAGKPKYLRVSVNAQQPDRHLQLVEHPADRWQALGINVQPASQRGDYILLCGIGPKQCARHGLQYGQWERETYRKLKAATDRPIFCREKPKNPRIDGVPRLSDMPASAAIRGAWAVVCMTGNIGVDCIVEGVPVIAEGGPGSVYYRADLSEIDTIQPVAADARIKALSDIAYWQWTLAEISAGDLWANLRSEGLF
jgi:hypothetical protein